MEVGSWLLFLALSSFCFSSGAVPAAETKIYRSDSEGPSFRYFVVSAPLPQSVPERETNNNNNREDVDKVHSSDEPENVKKNGTDSVYQIEDDFTTTGDLRETISDENSDQELDTTTTTTTTTTEVAVTEEESEFSTTEEPSLAVAVDEMQTTSEFLIEDCGFAITNYFNRVSRVVGGVPVDSYKFPWMVTVHYRFRFTCGGTLITSKFVLTAAHCLAKRNPRLLSVKNFSKYVLVQNSFINPEFWFFGHDAGLIQLKTPFGIPIPPVCISNMKAPGVGTPLRIIGKGRVKENGPLSQGFHSAVVQVLPNTPCERSYDRYFNPSFICAGTPSGVRDTCHGDSGGPLLRQVNGVWFQIGIVSFGDGCGRAGFPGVYSKVNLFFQWIKTVVSSESDV